MTAVTLVIKPVSQIQLAPGSTATIPNVSWQEFESILQELGERRRARVAYSNRHVRKFAKRSESGFP